VPDVQTQFDVSLIARDLGWKPKYPIANGLGAYRDAIEAGKAST
jgi:UDP-glucuronate 4-epimerase